jgi:predicted phosphodiesterase
MKSIYSVDNHFTVNPPVSRIDDFVETQKNLLNWLSEQLEKHNANHLCGGDTGDKDSYKNSDMMLKLINFLLVNLPKTIGIIGNHDLKYRNWKYFKDSFISAIVNAGVYTVLTKPYEIQKDVWVHPFSYGKEVKHIENLDSYSKESKHVMLYHGFVYDKQKVGCNGYYAKDLMYEFPEYDMFLTGDNHTKFVIEQDGQILINGGSFYRKSIDQLEHSPAVWLIDWDTFEYKEIPVPDSIDNISTEHKDKVEHKTNTMESVVNVVKSSEGVTLSFENELAEIIEENKKIVDSEVQEYVDKITEKEEIYVR